MGKTKDENLFVAFAGSYLRFEEELGDANLFADWLFFRITTEFEVEPGLRVGAVFRLAPLTDGDIARDMRERFQLRTPTARKVRRWRYVLTAKGIIAPLRTPRGHRLLVLDTNKFKSKPDPLPGWAKEIVNRALARRPEGLTNIWHATDHQRSGDLPPAVGGLTMSGQSNKRTELENKEETVAVVSVPSRPRFVKPSIEEIRDYMASIGMSNPDSQARAFYDRNEERGWIPSGSRTQMRSWRAACRTWKRNAPRFSNVSGGDDDGWR